MYTIYLCDRQPYGECPCPWKSCNECQPEQVVFEEDDTDSEDSPDTPIINKEEPEDE